MKFISFCAVLLLLFSACEEGEPNGTRTFEDFRANDFNFVFNVGMKYKGIRYKIPEIFEFAQNQNYANNLGSGTTIRSYARYDLSYNFNIYYSIEVFRESDRDMWFLEDVVMTKDLLNYFHDGYVNTRINSIERGFASLKKKVNLKNYNGVIQVVRGDVERTYEDESDMHYAIATIKVKDEYYVFQWMCDKEMMDYTYDDFERMLKTVRPLK